MGRSSRKILFLLLALGIVLRVRQYAACPSYWYDEAYLLLNVFHKSFRGLLGPLREDQAAPPLFLWLLRGLYQLAGGSEWWMRLPALAASVAGLLAMVPLARRIAGRRSGGWVIAFCVFGHHAIAHAGEVKPYAWDFLMTELILLAAIVMGPASRRSTAPDRRDAGPTKVRGTVCFLAMLAPWASYPAVFVLGAASLSLLLHALRRRDRSLLVFWALATGLFVSSCLILWQLAVRHQTTSALRAFWQSSFLDLSSPTAAVAWTARCLNEIGNYGTREMGVPLVVLALIGMASLGRRPTRLVLLLGPLLLALLASALRLYPLGGRLLFFLVPCMWLLAARGIGVLTRRLSGRAAWLGWVLPLALLIPALGWAGRRLIVVTPRCQFREAFAYVEQHRAPDDLVWVSHPQVYEVYYGRTPDFSAYSPPRIVEQAARSRQLWMVCAVAGSRRRYTAADTVRRVKAASCVALDRRRFRGLEVVLYGPSTSPAPRFLPKTSP